MISFGGSGEIMINSKDEASLDQDALACDLVFILFSNLGVVFGGLTKGQGFLDLSGMGLGVGKCINMFSTSSSDTFTLPLFDFFLVDCF